MTGILLINSILINSQTQKTLFDSEVNKKNIYDLFSYLNRIKVRFYLCVDSNIFILFHLVFFFFFFH